MKDRRGIMKDIRMGRPRCNTSSRSRVSMKTTKKSLQDLILHRLREYLQYAELRSLIPPRPAKQKSRSRTGLSMVTDQVRDSEAHEIQTERSRTGKEINSVNASPASSSPPSDDDLKFQEEEDKDCSCEVFESAEDPFVPFVTITKMEDSLLIRAIVLKEFALTSVLFQILEEEGEKIEVVSENQYRTESKVAHTIQVKVQPDYNVDALEKKLCAWAGN